MKILLILGNGFTIDFLSSLGQLKEIDVLNLFSKGADVSWPANGEPGFLSYKNCPNLWNLGARSTLSGAETIGLIEDIITCANVISYSSQPITFFNKDSQQLHIKAYSELSLYLRHLFIFYDKKISTNLAMLSNWNWAEFFKKIHSHPDVTELKIITYNYDIWLERALMTLEIPFSIEVISNQNPTGSKVSIYKPHGSISFVHEKYGEHAAFNIPYDRDIHSSTSSEFKVEYNELDKNYFMNAMIPPAGDPSRLRHSWAGDIREKAKEAAKNMSKNDLAIVCGLSYWHVDRNEIDEILTSLDPEVNVKMINPNPPRAMSAVLTSLFKKYIHHTSSTVLKELLK